MEAYSVKEEYMIRTSGGPFDGETRIISHGAFGWPPPPNLPGVFHGGVYIRTNFSKLSEQDAGSGIMRGADYEWMGYDDVPTTRH